MKEMNEQGFLSDKFDDWSGEPIPNGWGEIEKNLRKDKKRRPVFWWLFPSFFVVGVISYVAVERLNTLSVQDEQIVASVPSRPSEEKDRSIVSNLHPETNPEKGNQPAAESGGQVAGIPSPENDKAIQTPQETASPNTHSEYGDALSKNQLRIQKNSVNASVALATTDQVQVTDRNSTARFQNDERNDRSIANLSNTGSGIEKSRRKKLKGSSELAAAGSSRRLTSGVSESGSGLVGDPQAGSSPIQSSDGNASKGQMDAGREVNSNPIYSQATDVPYLDLKNAQLPAVKIRDELPVLALREITEVPSLMLDQSEPKRKLQFYAGLQTGIGQNSIELRQSITEQHVHVANANSIQTYFMQLSGGMHFQLSSWLKAFTGLQVGVISQSIRYTTKSKSPEQFSMIARDSLQFDMTPHWTEKSETRTQKAVFVNAEAGLKPLLFPARNSGPFASVVVWTRISEKNSSNVPGSSPFIPVTNSVSVGYRIGYQHEIKKNILFEAYLSSFPSGIFARTKGITITPRLVGLGCFYSF